jgi:hypothetical protein
MPQLVKGGKHVFGWSVITDELKVRIPDEAYDEYSFGHTDKIIILSGSETSGGFSINTPCSVANSKFGDRIISLIGYIKESDEFTIKRQKIVRAGERFISWTNLLDDKSFYLSDDLMDFLGVHSGSRLLAARGSGVGMTFISRGPIYNEALKHNALLVYH